MTIEGPRKSMHREAFNGGKHSRGAESRNVSRLYHLVVQ